MHQIWSLKCHHTKSKTTIDYIQFIFIHKILKQQILIMMFKSRRFWLLWTLLSKLVPFLEGSPHEIIAYHDHKNLTYFQIIHKLVGHNSCARFFDHVSPPTTIERHMLYLNIPIWHLAYGNFPLTIKSGSYFLSFPCNCK